MILLGTIKRGDVMVFKYPEDPERDFIKRVIGLPGDTVELKQKKVLHQRDAARRTVRRTSSMPPRTDAAASEVTSLDVRERFGPGDACRPNQYFMMGDNRDNSQDSRYWGFMPRDYMKGKALVIYWSYEAEREDYESTGAADTVERGSGLSLRTSSRGPDGTGCCIRFGKRIADCELLIGTANR
ncbi:MAG: signal peptidase I [Vicinamibacterales bacterium]